MSLTAPRSHEEKESCATFMSLLPLRSFCRQPAYADTDSVRLLTIKRLGISRYTGRRSR